MIATGFFSPEEPTLFTPIVDALTKGGDRYMVLADYGSFVACQDRLSELYRDPHEWSRKAILNVANLGVFSRDRTILEYAQKIWRAHSEQINLGHQS